MTAILNENGQKYTLTEYFRKVNKEGLFQIESIKHGTYVTGTYDYIRGCLSKEYFSFCIQGVEVTEYGTILYLR